MLLSLTAFAEETLTGTVGNATWTLTQNADETTYTLDITGSGTLGKINDIASYKNRITYVRIIMSISPASFSRCTALANVYVEDSTVLIEKEGAAKGAYPFVTSSGAPATLNITAKTGSSAHEYALRHDEVTYVPPTVKNIMSDTGVLDTIEIVTGFAPPNYYRIENKIYILFADAACTTLVREASSDAYGTIYGKTLLESVGFMVRAADYNGLSSLYRFDTTLLGSLGIYSIAEVGTLGSLL